MPRVLLLATTTTYRAGAFLDAARALGVETVVGGERPQALAALNPDGHLTLDFGAPRVAARAIVEYAARHPLGAVIGADDDAVVVAAHAADALGLRHHPVAAVRAARSKLESRAAFARAGLPSPRYETWGLEDDLGTIVDRIEFPCVVKPLFLSASRGVIRADTREQLVAALARVGVLLGRPEIAARGGVLSGEVLIESYIPGVEVALEGLLTAGQLRTLAIFDKPDPLHGPFFEETLYVTPSRLAPDVQDLIRSTAGRAVATLGLTDGPIHAELRLNQRGVFVVEIAPRSIGGLCSRSLRFGTGVSLETLILRHALGLATDDLEREDAASGVMMIPIPRAGTLAAIRGLDDARRMPKVEEVRITIPVGQALEPLPEGDRYLGFIFARANSPDRVEAALRKAHGRLSFDIVSRESGSAAPARIEAGRSNP